VTNLGGLVWPDVAARAPTTVLVIPLGATEQHGPHLPLATDTEIAVALAGRLAEARTDVVVAPALAYGSSGEHAGFPGTLSIGQEALELVVVELVRSADAFAGVLILSAHGGNAAPVRRAVDRLAVEGRRVMMWCPPATAPTDTHAGHTETSLVLAVQPGQVDIGRAEAGTSQPLGELWPALRRHGVAGVSANGVLGDPTGASAEAGRRLLDRWSADLHDAVAAWP
jgi:mycofactocin system creatininase family protein